MNEKLVGQALDEISKMVIEVAKAKDFCIEQAPDIINQLLVYKFYQSLFGVIVHVFFVLLFFATSYILYVKFFNKEKDIFKSDMAEMISILSFAFGVLTFVPLLFHIARVPVFIQIYLAPKIYLLEYASALVK